MPFVAWGSLLCTAFVSMLRYSDYPLFRPEVAIVVAGILLLAGIAALLYVGQRNWGRSLLNCLLVFSAAGLMGLPLGATFLIAFAAMALILWTRKQLSPFLASMGTIMLLTTLAGLGGHQPWIESESRPTTAKQTEAAPESTILHLVLDEHTGVESLPDSDQEARLLKNDLKSFYLSRGFTLFGRSYSTSMHTVNAVPWVLNYGLAVGEHFDGGGVRFGASAYMRDLVRDGFRVHIYQSDFADICSGVEHASCSTYSYTSLRPTLDLEMSVLERAELLATHLISIFEFAVRTDRLWRAASSLSGRTDRLPNLELAQRSRTSTTVSLAAFDSMVQDLRSAAPGNVYFGHFLFPHFPYVVDENCRHLSRSQWESRLSANPISQREKAYFKQVRCALKKVDAAIRAAEASSGGKNLIVIVHGDHGSKIVKQYPDYSNIDDLTEEDLIAAFPTLFAFRASSGDARYIEGVAPTAAILRGIVAAEFQFAPEVTDRTPSVVLDDREWNPQVRVPLPTAW